MGTKSKKFKSYESAFSNKEKSIEALQSLFKKYRNSIIVISYSSNSNPDKSEMTSMLKKEKRHVTVFEVDYHYSFANRANINRRNEVKEYLFIGSD